MVKVTIADGTKGSRELEFPTANRIFVPKNTASGVETCLEVSWGNNNPIAIFRYWLYAEVVRDQ